jgi:hypothetical protein
MKNIHRTAIVSVIILSSALLAGCGESDTSGTTDVANNHYYGKSDSECRQILYTCPQNEEPFTDASGCGCKPAGKTIDNANERSLDSLIMRYLKEKMVTPTNGGKIAAEFSRLGASEQGATLTEEVYGIVDEFYMDGDKIAYGAKKEGIFQLKIEETNLNYIIRGVTFFDINNITDDQKKSLSPETLVWLGKTENMDKLRTRIQTMVKQDGAISFGRPVEDFVDYVAPGAVGTQEGTQQATQQGATTQAGTQQ